MRKPIQPRNPRVSEEANTTPSSGASTTLSDGANTTLSLDAEDGENHHGLIDNPYDSRYDGAEPRAKPLELRKGQEHDPHC